MEITQRSVKELFDYKDGFLYWKVRNARRLKIGDKAGYLNKMKKGSRQVIMINNESFLASRLIFLWHNGYLPIIVDHRDTNTSNDNIENLRDADYLKNSYNSNKKKSVSTSIFKGVYLTKNKKWRVRISASGTTINIGYFEIEAEAAAAYNIASIKYHGEFANLNIIK